MKRNWSIIIAIIVFLIAYDVFVLRPFNQKIAVEKKKTQKQETQSNKSNVVDSSANTAVNTNSTIVETNIETTQNPNLDIKPVGKLFLGEKRSATIYSDGSLKEVVFNDYFHRGVDEVIPVKILKDGLRWSSSNPLVQKCIDSFSLVSKESFSFVGKSGNLSCSLKYIPSESNPSIYTYKFDITNLESFTGLVYLQHTSRLGEGNRFDFKALDFKLDGEKEHIQGDSVFETQSFRGKIEWASWGDKYFTTIILPKGTFNPDLVVSAIDSEAVEESQRRFKILYQYPLIDIGQKTLSFESDIYLGTKNLGVLKSIRKDLVEAVDMGWFATVGRFMLWCLEKLNLVFNNFGWSIIALTVLVRLAFWPLNKKVFASGQSMKTLQPKVEAIKKKYGKDKSQMEQMNREMMALYKKEKVNPMGSCLPLLLQMPIFIGLYGSLSNSIDLYQAPFIGWIQDLSYRDPFYILPILWTASLLLMMKFTPQPTMSQPGMPDMKKVMFVMYFVFGFMAKDWPAGLCLYLVVSSFLGTWQQFLFRRSQSQLQIVQEGA